MNKFKQWLKSEIDVEFFACVHGMCLVWVYGFLMWLCKVETVSFFVISEMMILGYFIAWFQKLLFFKERVYKKLEYRIRVVLWSIGPFAFIVPARLGFGWFRGANMAAELVFYGIMLCYFIMVWVFIHLFYKEDSSQLNQMLYEFKKGIKKEE